MDRIALFLRGINLGSRRVKGAELERALTDAGFRAPQSYQASGNVVIDPPTTGGEAAREARRGDGPARPTPKDGEHRPVAARAFAELEKGVEAAMLEGVGFEASAFARTLPDLASLTRSGVIADGEAEGFTPHVIFLKAPVGEDSIEALRALETPDDRFPSLGREVVWLRRGRLTDSTVSSHQIERALGKVPNTMRKITTLRRMVRKFGG